MGDDERNYQMAMKQGPIRVFRLVKSNFLIWSMINLHNLCPDL